MGRPPAASFALAGVLAACGGGRAIPPEVRFHNQPPVWVVNDRRDVPEKPREPRFLIGLYHFDGRWQKRIDRWLQMRPAVRAQNVNSLDEVPDSTWFTNRIGVRDLTPAEIAAGPNRTGSPQAHKPWRIESSKEGGKSVGFVISDARDIRYVLKFEERGIPEVETAAAVIIQRLLFAAGYNVPEDHIVELEREDLVVGPDSVVADAFGDETRMTEAFVDRLLAQVDVRPDGSFRALASEFLPGVPIGGHARDGVRDDDPNDRIPHERRRELRGSYAIFSWLDQVDVKEDNTLDVYVEDPVRRGVHYVVHYFIDFGKGLGALSYFRCRAVAGRRVFDSKASLMSLLTFGLILPQPVTCRTQPVPGVAPFDDDFDPGGWKPNTPSYFPYLDVDRFDGFWGAKIVARFTREHVRAAVERGRLSDPRAVDQLVDVLLRRQRRLARYWFERVNPLDRFEVVERGRAWTLCFDDLAVKYRLVSLTPRTTYRVRTFDYDGVATTSTRRIAAAGAGRTCVAGLRPTSSRDGYTIVELVTDGRSRMPPTFVHLARDPRASRPRVIGLVRQ